MRVRPVITALLCMGLMQAGAVDASDRFRSPRNPERRLRASTELIVLHTTEAPARSSLNKLSDRGEAHYCVTEEGRIFRIVDRDRMAFHAGRSMWNGKEDVDNFSIGVECVGHHDQPMGSAQLAAIRDLVHELQALYRIPDDRVVCHSHVAYGMPNRWQKRKHRGRKRCGMLFAMASVRRELGLKSRPAVDADVKARRLVVGDDYLRRVLYGNVDTMAGRVVRTPPAEPAQGGIFDWFRSISKPAGRQQDPPVPKPALAAKPVPAPKAPPKPALAAKPAPAPKAPPKIAAKTPPRSASELKARGYSVAGKVTQSTTASKIVGKRWNSPDTFYTIRNKVIPGNQIDPKRLEIGMLVWTR